MSLVFATTFFFFFFLIWGGGGGGGGGELRHSAVQTDFEFEISGPLIIIVGPKDLLTLEAAQPCCMNLRLLTYMLANAKYMYSNAQLHLLMVETRREKT